MSNEQLLLVQDGKLYGRDPVFAVICKASLLPDVVKNHDLQKNEAIVQLGQVQIQKTACLYDTSLPFSVYFLSFHPETLVRF